MAYCAKSWYSACALEQKVQYTALSFRKQGSVFVRKVGTHNQTAQSRNPKCHNAKLHHYVNVTVHTVYYKQY